MCVGIAHRDYDEYVIARICIDVVYCKEPDLPQVIQRFRSRYGPAEVIPMNKEAFLDTQGAMQKVIGIIGVRKQGREFVVAYNKFKMTKKSREDGLRNRR